MSGEIISIVQDKLWTDNTANLQLNVSGERKLKWNIAGKKLRLENLGIYWDHKDYYENRNNSDDNNKTKSNGGQQDYHIENLDIYWDHKDYYENRNNSDDNNKTKSGGDQQDYHTTGLIGVLPVLWQDEDKPDCSCILAVKSRWGDPMKMLDVVLRSNDFSGDEAKAEPKIKTWNEWKEVNLTEKGEEILYGVVSDLPEIRISGDKNGNALKSLANVESVFLIYQFLEQLERICKRLVKQSSLPHEENLVGKVKGRILIHKQIKENLAKGRLDRTYCCYNKMTIDNMENRILKYALHLCKTWSNERGSVFSDKIVFCEGVLKPVKLVKVTQRDIMSVKNNGAFKDYRKGIKLARDILRRMSMEFQSGQNPTVTVNSVKPFFINMNLLFELYCRALIEKAAKQANLTLGSSDNRKKKLFENGNKVTGFQQEHILDILITGKDHNNKDYNLILDAKYSTYFGENEASVREYTHQVLSYMLIWDADDCGFIYPIKVENKVENSDNSVEIERKIMFDIIKDNQHAEESHGKEPHAKERYAISIGIYENATPEDTVNDIGKSLQNICKNRKIEM